MAQRITPTLDPLPQETSTYRTGNGRLKRLTVVPVPHPEPDLDRFTAALLALAMERLEAEKRQRAVRSSQVDMP